MAPTAMASLGTKPATLQWNQMWKMKKASRQNHRFHKVVGDREPPDCVFFFFYQVKGAICVNVDLLKNVFRVP